MEDSRRLLEAGEEKEMASPTKLLQKEHSPANNFDISPANPSCAPGSQK